MLSLSILKHESNYCRKIKKNASQRKKTEQFFDFFFLSHYARAHERCVCEATKYKNLGSCTKAEKRRISFVE